MTFFLAFRVILLDPQHLATNQSSHQLCFLHRRKLPRLLLPPCQNNPGQHACASACVVEQEAEHQKPDLEELESAAPKYEMCSLPTTSHYRFQSRKQSEWDRE